MDVFVRRYKRQDPDPLSPQYAGYSSDSSVAVRGKSLSRSVASRSRRCACVRSVCRKPRETLRSLITRARLAIVCARRAIRISGCLRWGIERVGNDSASIVLWKINRFSRFWRLFVEDGSKFGLSKHLLEYSVFCAIKIFALSILV